MGDLLYLTKEMWEEFRISIYSLKLRKMKAEQVILMFETLLTGAFRISDILELTPEDILSNGKIRLRKSKGGWLNCDCSVWKFRPTKLQSSDKDCKKCQGKGKYRIDQFGWVQDNILTKLRVLASETRPGKKLFPITSRQALNYANEIMGARTHTFRHTWLTWLWNSGKMDLIDLKQKSRHKNIQTTITYIEKNDDVIRQKERNSDVKI